MHLTVLQNPGYTSARLSQIESQIKIRLNIAIHTIHRRLAVDFLSAEQLNILFVKLNKQAAQNGCQLLIHHRSDLFQLETSYFFDGADVHLLLHVPMVPTDSLLRLFKLHPFPFPLSGSHVLVPSLREDILAILSGFKRYSAQFSTTDLLGCHMVNNIYLCERHGVLNSNLNSTCLVALYMQDYDTIKRFYALEIHRTGEIVTSTTEQLVSGLNSILTNHPHLLFQWNSVRETYLKGYQPNLHLPWMLCSSRLTSDLLRHLRKIGN